MASKLRVRPLLSSLVALSIGLAYPVFASGAFAPEAVFETVATPEPGRLNSYLKGDIGVLRPQYGLLYLWAAQRAVLGRPLGASEVALARVTQLENGASEDGYSVWRRTRAAVGEDVELAPAAAVEVFGTLTQSEVDLSFLNCQDDAFYTAAKRLGVLHERMRATTEPVLPQWLQDWVRGQDTVFGNCAIVGGQDPHAPAADAPAWLRDDRAYQRAAAYFYRGDSAAAATAFAAIAADAQSSWQEVAAYLVARTWVREALYFTAPGPARDAALARAAAAARAGLAEPRLRDRHPAFAALQRRVALLRDPTAAFNAAVGRLDSGISDDFVQDLEEVRFLRDDVAPEVAARAWLVNVKDEDPRAYAIALEEWRRLRSRDWLLATLLHAPADDVGTVEALAAVAAIALDAPASLPLQFERARLLVARHDAAATSLLDSLLARTDLALSDRNALRRLRFAGASSLADALRFAAGLPVGIAYESERDIWPNWSRAPEPEASTPAAVKPAQASGADAEQEDTAVWEAESWPLLTELRRDGALLPDVAAQLDRWLPAALLLQAARNTTSGLPANVRAQLAGSAWLRAFLLRQPQLLAEATPTFVLHFPQARELLGNGAAVLPSGPEVSAAAFRSAVAVLRLPGLSPHVRGGVDRALPADAIGQLSLFRWWFSGREEFSLDGEVDRPAFVSAELAARADAEYGALAGIEDATHALAPVVLGYAQSHADDALVPEALHLLVRATRYGTADTAISKRAYSLLHKRYPKGEWARRTPYFY